jgi:hypothetical protein
MDLLREFSDADVEFVVVGGAAVNLYGHRRSREDLDLVIDGVHMANMPGKRGVHLWYGVPLIFATDTNAPFPTVQRRDHCSD